MKKPRFVAGILFGVLTFVHYFSMFYIFSSVAITNMPLLFFPEVMVLGVYFWACYKNIGQEGSLTASQKKQVVAVSVMYLIFNGINVATTLDITSGSLGAFSEALGQNKLAAIAVLVAKLVLFVVAVCFVISEPKNTQAQIKFGEIDNETATNEIEKIEEIDAAVNDAIDAVDKAID